MEDIARVIYEVIKEKAVWKGEVYNIPGNQRYTVLEVLKWLEEIMGKEIKARFVSDRPGHDRMYCMSTKLRYDVTPFKDGLMRTGKLVSQQQVVVGALNFRQVHHTGRTVEELIIL